ncbi:FAD-dependent oxidoreductase [Streptomyces sp. NBC_01178]|uniref:FAD-dependent oxidoreductase n=1 Tax=Streptomyces sp. NBC_01178 TaxID=2903762 RepID=UPI0038695267|nr:FAD-dependent oxidoreductase [Streptomyces sp. NBC_01178]
MRSTAYHADVIIIGAGIAGLSAAHLLIRAGLGVSVLEAEPRVGGRLATDEVDGFRLDRLGPLLSGSWPELTGSPGLGSLELREFAPGVLVHSEGRRHLTGDIRSARGALKAARTRSSAPWPHRAPRTPGTSRASRTALSPRAPWASRVSEAPGGYGAHGAHGSVRSANGWEPCAPARGGGRGGAVTGAIDRARLGAALSRLAATEEARLLARPERTVADALPGVGLPARTVEGVLRPLLTTLLSDPALTTSSRCADLALRDYARGGLCVPAGGSAALPRLLAASLPPGTVRTGVHVTAVGTTSVRTKEHGELGCRSLLLATGAGAAAELLPGLRVPAFHPVTVLHHTAPAPPPTGRSLVLDGDRSGPVAHTAVMSEVDPSRAPEGRTLITSTVLGPPPPDLDRSARAHLAALYGVPTDRWELLAARHDPEAVPAMEAPHDPRRPVRVLAGLYVCGDHRGTSTVQGALHSGRRAAKALLADLALPGAREGSPRLPEAA